MARGEKTEQKENRLPPPLCVRSECYIPDWPSPRTNASEDALFQQDGAWAHYPVSNSNEDLGFKLPG